jgi:hypothetical protein
MGGEVRSPGGELSVLILFVKGFIMGDFFGMGQKKAQESNERMNKETMDTMKEISKDRNDTDLQMMREMSEMSDRMWDGVEDAIRGISGKSHSCVGHHSGMISIGTERVQPRLEISGGQQGFRASIY